MSMRLAVDPSSNAKSSLLHLDGLPAIWGVKPPTVVLLMLLHRRLQQRLARLFQLRRLQYRFSRHTLQGPAISAFQRLYWSGWDQSLITLTGFAHGTFRYLLERF